jgi:hypothetical protein
MFSSVLSILCDFLFLFYLLLERSFAFSYADTQKKKENVLNFEQFQLVTGSFFVYLGRDPLS